MTKKNQINILKFLIPVLILLAGIPFLQDRVDSSTLSIKTPLVSTLYPHEHTLEDSIFDTDHGTISSSDIYVVAEDIWVTRIEFLVHNADRIVVHHAQLFRLDKPNKICPNYLPEEIIVMASDTMNDPIDFPEPYGVFLPKGTPIILSVVLHNPFSPYGPGEIYYDVSTEIVLDIKTEERVEAEFYRLHLDEIACDEKVGGTFIVPPYSESIIKEPTENEKDPARHVFSRAGTILSMGSHVHAWEGGENLKVFLNDNLFHEFLPYRISLDPWSWRNPRLIPISVRVKAGDIIHVTSTYSNPTDTLIRGAMGMLGFYFAPDESDI